MSAIPSVSSSGLDVSRGDIPEDDFKEQEQHFPDHWITPEEQLERLAFSAVREGFPALTESQTKACAKIILETFLDATNREGSNERVPRLTDLIVKRLFPSSLTNWYTALKRLGVHLIKIPPLPNHIYHILKGKCPIFGDQRKPDGTFYKVENTHVFSLVPKELGTLNQFEKNILKPYGEEKYSKDENPLQFRYFWDAARQEHAAVPFPETSWVLMTKDVLPGSRNKPWGEQTALVDALARKAFVDYEVPTLQEAFAAIMLNKVATGKSLYRAGNAENGNVWTYTRVQETTRDCHLAIGGFREGSAPSGMLVDYDFFDFGNEYVGVAARRKF